jgi:23S rRNA (cytidine2498-2'-O)-methyltransferase
VTTGYLAAEGYVPELLAELGAGVVATHGRLVLAEGPPRDAAWAQNVWHDPVEIPFASVAEGARELRAIQRNWALYSFALHRRALLVEAKLPKVSCRPLVFPAAPPAAPLGSWTLVGSERILASARCSSPFRHGEVAFVEDREGPPNRAYLKLWEAFTLLGRMPAPNDRCVDLGASPGGWTWVLAKLGAGVLAIDKAPLDPLVAAMPGVEARQESAFGVRPFPVDWVFCDVACYPDRLLELARRWLDSATNLVCTIKFQGKTDLASAAAFRAIEGSRLLHLWHNRHELTWARLGAT